MIILINKMTTNIDCLKVMITRQSTLLNKLEEKVDNIEQIVNNLSNSGVIE